MRIWQCDLGGSIEIEKNDVKEYIVNDRYFEFVDTDSCDGGLYVILT
jgi:hypothetical protein